MSNLWSSAQKCEMNHKISRSLQKNTCASVYQEVLTLLALFWSKKDNPFNGALFKFTSFLGNWEDVLLSCFWVEQCIGAEQDRVSGLGDGALGSYRTQMTLEGLKGFWPCPCEGQGISGFYWVATAHLLEIQNYTRFINTRGQVWEIWAV